MLLFICKHHYQRNVGKYKFILVRGFAEVNIPTEYRNNEAISSKVTVLNGVESPGFYCQLLCHILNNFLK